MPYTLLSEIPERAKYFSVIDLKVAFWSYTYTKSSSAYDFKTIKRILGHYRLLLHLDSGL